MDLVNTSKLVKDGNVFIHVYKRFLMFSHKNAF